MEKMSQYSPLWPHGKIKQIFENIYMVTGTNIITYEGNEIQHSRNMVIVKEGNNFSIEHLEDAFYHF